MSELPSTLDASCQNCMSWQADACARDLVPDEGSLYCGEYAITDAFRSEIASAVLQDGGIPMEFTAKGLMKLKNLRTRRGLAGKPAPADATAAAEAPVGRHSRRRAGKRR